MTLWQKILLWVLGLAATLFVAAQVIVYLAFSDMCANDVWAEYPSPDGQYLAIVFERNCGATTGFSTQISIIENGDELDSRAGNVFIIEGHPDDIAPTALWRNDRELFVDHKLTGNESLAVRIWNNRSQDIKVKYAQ